MRDKILAWNIYRNISSVAITMKQAPMTNLQMFKLFNFPSSCCNFRVPTLLHCNWFTFVNWSFDWEGNFCCLNFTCSRFRIAWIFSNQIWGVAFLKHQMVFHLSVGVQSGSAGCRLGLFYVLLLFTNFCSFLSSYAHFHVIKQNKHKNVI